MKITVVTDNYYPNVNGSSYFAQRLAFYLKKHGQEVSVICPSRSLHDEIFEYEGVKVYGIRSMPFERMRVALPFGPVITKKIEKIIKEIKPDVIHVQDHFAVSRKAVNIAKKLHIPAIGTNHFMPENLVHYLHLPPSFENFVKNMLWKYFAVIYKRLNAVTTPTHKAASLLKDVKLKNNVIVMSNGIDLTKFKYANNGAYVREKYNIPNKPILLYVGRLDKEKNLDKVIRALKNVVKKTPVHLVIAGVGAETKNLKKLVKALEMENDVTFTGFVEDKDLPDLYTIADVFINAGIAELQSIVTMEAMATGLPIIGANVMALPELISHSENGFLFEHGDIEKIAQYIEKLFTDPELRKKMGIKSLEIIQKHEISKIIENFISLYKTL